MNTQPVQNLQHKICLRGKSLDEIISIVNEEIENCWNSLHKSGFYHDAHSQYLFLLKLKRFNEIHFQDGASTPRAAIQERDDILREIPKLISIAQRFYAVQILQSKDERGRLILKRMIPMLFDEEHWFDKFLDGMDTSIKLTIHDLEELANREAKELPILSILKDNGDWPKIRKFLIDKLLIDENLELRGVTSKPKSQINYLILFLNEKGYYNPSSVSNWGKIAKAWSETLNGLDTKNDTLTSKRLENRKTPDWFAESTKLFPLKIKVGG